MKKLIIVINKGNCFYAGHHLVPHTGAFYMMVTDQIHYASGFDDFDLCKTAAEKIVAMYRVPVDIEEITIGELITSI